MEHIRHDRLLKSLLINWRGKGLGKEGLGKGFRRVGESLSRAGESGGGHMDGWMDGTF